MNIDCAVGGDFNNAVGDRLDKLVVVGGKKDGSSEAFKSFVEGCDRFKVQVVGL